MDMRPFRKSKRFQSTPSVGRATQLPFIKDVGAELISIHALRGEGDILRACLNVSFVVISIHALRGEGDVANIKYKGTGLRFQSTPSVGRATDLWQYFITLTLEFQSTPSVGRATRTS